LLFPGGFGTLDEVSEAMTLIQTGKSERFPIILVGKKLLGGILPMDSGVHASGKRLYFPL